MPEVTTNRRLDIPRQGRRRLDLDPDSFARLSEGEVEAVQAPSATDDAENASPGRVVSLGGHRERR